VSPEYARFGGALVRWSSLIRGVCGFRSASLSLGHKKGSSDIPFPVRCLVPLSRFRFSLAFSLSFILQFTSFPSLSLSLSLSLFLSLFVHHFSFTFHFFRPRSTISHSFSTTVARTLHPLYFIAYRDGCLGYSEHIVLSHT
jgi:hypothetical protein